MPGARILDQGTKNTVESANLRYVTDDMPGIKRLRSGRGFRYIDANSRSLKEPEVLSRIRALAIPPAWTSVWICSSEKGHIQATGRDARTRKQYLYHSRWREHRDSTKYDRLSAFGRALPGLRARLEHDLSLPGLPREKVLATIVKLLELTLIRIGNERIQAHQRLIWVDYLYGQITFVSRARSFDFSSRERAAYGIR